MTEMMGKVGTKMEWQRITEFLMSTKENEKGDFEWSWLFASGVRMEIERYG